MTTSPFKVKIKVGGTPVPIEPLLDSREPAENILIILGRVKFLPGLKARWVGLFQMASQAPSLQPGFALGAKQA